MTLLKSISSISPFCKDLCVMSPIALSCHLTAFLSHVTDSSSVNSSFKLLLVSPSNHARIFAFALSYVVPHTAACSVSSDSVIIKISSLSR